MTPPAWGGFTLEGVTHALGGRPVLREVSLRLPERRIGVVGANGSGKSTFARLLNGLLVPDTGRVLAEELDTRRDGRAVRRRVGFVFQNPDHQIVYPTVGEDVAFGLRPLRLTAGEAAARVEAVLARFGLAAHADRPAHLLSGGEKQLLAIAGAVIAAPRAVIFDEPTTLLDRRNARTVARTIDALDQATLVVSHDLDLLRHVERVLVFDRGGVVIDDTPARALPAYVALMDTP